MGDHGDTGTTEDDEHDEDEAEEERELQTLYECSSTRRFRPTDETLFGTDDETGDVERPEAMRGYIDSHGDVERHRENIRRGAQRADSDSTEDADASEDEPTPMHRSIADSAGNWPGLGEAIRTQRASKGRSQPRLAVATAPVEEIEGHVVPIGAEFALTHVVQGTEDDARKAFAARCQRQGFEILEPPIVEAITLEDLLQRVNDPDSSLGSIYPT